jgi:hypothetical protein
MFGRLLEQLIRHLSNTELLDNAGEFPPNVEMIRRLENALRNGTPISESDLSFYLHELAEAEIISNLIDNNATVRELVAQGYPLNILITDPTLDRTWLLGQNINSLPPEIRRDLLYHYGHEAALDQYQVSRYSLYAPEVVESNPNDLDDSGFVEFWRAAGTTGD